MGQGLSIKINLFYKLIFPLSTIRNARKLMDREWIDLKINCQPIGKEIRFAPSRVYCSILQRASSLNRFTILFDSTISKEKSPADQC